MGILWTGIEKVVVYGINFVQGVILARLLCPEDFGLTAMLGIFIGLGGTLAESGLGTALVIGVKGHGDPVRRLERQVLGWNVGTAVVIYAVLALVAPWCAAWYGKPLLTPILRAMAAGLVINALSVVATARLTREERFGRLAGVNGLSTLFGASAAIALAWAGCGVWSIVGLGLVAAAFRTGFAWMAARDDGNEAEAASAADGMDFRAALKYGWKLMVSGLTHVVYMESYNMVIGKMWSPSAVGLFVRGQRWAKLPAEVVNDAVGRVALPVLSRANGSGALRFTLINTALLWPGLAVLGVWAPEIVRFVFGEQWLASVPCLRILICGQLFTPFGNIALNALRARGRADLILKTDAVKKPLGLVALACGIPFGLVGICWAKVASDFFEAAADAWYAWRGKLPGPEKPEETEGPIDLVYLWYGKKDPPPGVEKCRASDNGELCWSLKSVDRFAPWFRRIFVLVNDGTEIPDWLSSHPRVRVLEHRQFIESWALPLYNTAAIEMWIDRVPGLSERFVYGNDDYFFGRAVSPRDFFDARGRIVYWHFPGGNLKDMRGSSYFDMLRYSRRILGTSEQCMPHHNFQGCLKSEITAFRRQYPAETKASAGRRYRVGEQLCFDAFALYMVLKGRGVKRSNFGLVRIRRMLGLPAYESMYVAIEDRPWLAWMESNRPKMFCLNDTEKSTDEDRANVAEVLKRMIG